MIKEIDWGWIGLVELFVSFENIYFENSESKQKVNCLKSQKLPLSMNKQDLYINNLSSMQQYIHRNFNI
jgi:hypothetical protein